MDYSTYKQKAERYIIEKKGTLDVMKTYNQMFEESVSIYMLKQLLQYCSQNPKDSQNASNINKKYWRRFVEEHRG